MPQQFKNPHNPKAHYQFTAPELWRQSGGKIDSFVAGIGSAGTIQGIGTFLKEHNPKVRIVAVEPAKHSALLGHEPGLHQIQGIGDGFIPPILDQNIIDEIIEVTDEDVIKTTRELSLTNSLLVGISSEQMSGAHARLPGIILYSGCNHSSRSCRTLLQHGTF